LHSSYELDREHGTEPLDKASTYASGAFDNTDSIDNTSKQSVGSETVPAPVEEIGKEFETNEPCKDCAENEKCAQYRLLPWWRDYSQGSCTYSPSDDSNILLTNGPGSGSLGIAYQGWKYGVAANAKGLRYLPDDYTMYGSGSGFQQCSTLLEEMGHNFQMSESEKGETYNEERTGNDFYHNGQWYVSPLGEGAQDGDNECGNNVNDCEGRRTTFWAGCSVNDYWKND